MEVAEPRTSTEKSPECSNGKTITEKYVHLISLLLFYQWRVKRRKGHTPSRGHLAELKGTLSLREVKGSLKELKGRLKERTYKQSLRKRRIKNTT